MAAAIGSYQTIKRVCAWPLRIGNVANHSVIAIAKFPLHAADLTHVGRQQKISIAARQAIQRQRSISLFAQNVSGRVFLAKSPLVLLICIG